jgi:hypothetical protein
MLNKRREVSGRACDLLFGRILHFAASLSGILPWHAPHDHPAGCWSWSAFGCYIYIGPLGATVLSTCATTTLHTAHCSLYLQSGCRLQVAGCRLRSLALACGALYSLCFMCPSLVYMQALAWPWPWRENNKGVWCELGHKSGSGCCYFKWAVDIIRPHTFKMPPFWLGWSRG